MEEKITTYDEVARVIALHLKEFCDDSLPYPEMIADAARKSAVEINVLRECVEYYKNMVDGR